ncbi:MAG: epoxide hydrolase [Gammaproteobacteria bacterium]|nr:MAG: epoxide hydrolase [Gammaproteobacteria bacterium]
MVDFTNLERICLPEITSALGNPLPAISLSVLVAGSGPTIVLAHGFPELAFSWRHQAENLIAAGYTVIIPDQRGYGDSDAPENVEDYSLEYLTADLVRLLDYFNIEKATFVGHDWGGVVTWAMPVIYPERTQAVVGVNMPYTPAIGLDILRRLFKKEEDLYMLWFQQRDIPEQVMDPYVEKLFNVMMRRPGSFNKSKAVKEKTVKPMLTGGGKANPFINIKEVSDPGLGFLTQAETDFYVAGFRDNGFRGPINWYRNIDRNSKEFESVGREKLTLPCLMVTAQLDAALPPAMAAAMPSMCSDLEMHNIEDCGHWTQAEKPEQLNKLLIEWFAKKVKP